MLTCHNGAGPINGLAARCPARCHRGPDKPHLHTSMLAGLVPLQHIKKVHDKVRFLGMLLSGVAFQH